MITTAFDTHEVYQTIKDAGLTDQQAKGIYEAIKLSHTSSELATKSDLDYKIETIRKDIEILRAETQKAISETKTQLILWGAGIGTAGVSVLVWFMERLHV